MTSSLGTEDDLRMSWGGGGGGGGGERKMTCECPHPPPPLKEKKVRKWLEHILYGQVNQ